MALIKQVCRSVLGNKTFTFELLFIFRRKNMTIPQAVNLGLTGDKISIAITGTSDVSAARTAIATGAGTELGAAASGALVVAASAAGFATAPITVPLAAAAGFVSYVSSRFKWW